MWKELTWDEVSAQCGHAVEVEYDFRPPVYPTPTPRRIGTFDKEMVKKAIWHCRPSLICLTHFDWLHTEVRETQKLGSVADSTVRAFEGWIEHPIHFVGVSPEVIIPTRSLSVRNERNLRVRE